MTCRFSAPTSHVQSYIILRILGRKVEFLQFTYQEYYQKRTPIFHAENNEKVTIFSIISLFCDTKDHWEPAGSFPVCTTAIATCSSARSRVPKHPHSQQPRGEGVGGPSAWRAPCVTVPAWGGGSSPSYLDCGADGGDRLYFLRKCS